MKLDFEGIYNLRDMGGIPAENGRNIKCGKLYRSSLLYYATENDKKRLEEMNIRRIFDFRTASEQAENPDPEIRGAVHIDMPPIFDITAGITRDSQSMKKVSADVQALCKTPEDAVNYMKYTYASLINDPVSIECYSKFMHMMLEPSDGAALWHCFGGKDRAGFAAVIMLYALGASDETVMSDYMYTNECSRREIDRIINGIPSEAKTKQAEDTLRNLFAAKEEYLEVILSVIRSQYGGTEGFLRDAMKLTHEDLAVLRSMYLS